MEYDRAVGRPPSRPGLPVAHEFWWPFIVLSAECVGWELCGRNKELRQRCRGLVSLFTPFLTLPATHPQCGSMGNGNRHTTIVGVGGFCETNFRETQSAAV